MKATLAVLLLALAILAWAWFRPLPDIDRHSGTAIVHSVPTIKPENPVYIVPRKASEMEREAIDY